MTLPGTLVLAWPWTSFSVLALESSWNDLLSSWYRLSLLSLGSNSNPPSPLDCCWIQTDYASGLMQEQQDRQPLPLGWRSLSHPLPELAQRNWRPSQVSLAACNTTTLRSHCPFLKEAGTLDSICCWFGFMDLPENSLSVC